MGYIKLNFKLQSSSFQNHVHEVQGFLKSSEDHYHRYVTVTGEAIQVDNNDHIHEVTFRTDFINGHYHEYIGRTLGAIVVGDRHIHYIDAVTTTISGHNHSFRLITLINDPTGD